MNIKLTFFLIFLVFFASLKGMDTVFYDQNLHLSNYETEFFRVVEMDEVGQFNSAFKDYENGNLIAEGEYVNAKKEGIFFLYDMNGEVLIKGTYRENKAVDDWYYYDNSVLKQHVFISDSGVVFHNYINIQGEDLDKMGDGEYLLDMGAIVIQGEIRDHFMDGKWVKKYKGEEVKEVEIFKNGCFKSGNEKSKSGIIYPYEETRILYDLIFSTYFLITEQRAVTTDNILTEVVSNSQKINRQNYDAFKVEKEDLANGLELRKAYYNDSIVSFTGVYKTGNELIAHGECRYYDKEGNLEIIGYYDNGKPVGEWKKFKDDTVLFSAKDIVKKVWEERCPPLLENEKDSEDVFFIADEMPQFKGGGRDEFRIYISEHLRYPAEAAEKGIDGRVFIQFNINRFGCVDQIEIVKSVHPALDAEALRVVSSSPRWKPGHHKGIPVNVQFTFPIVFVID